MKEQCSHPVVGYQFALQANQYFYLMLKFRQWTDLSISSNGGPSSSPSDGGPHDVAAEILSIGPIQLNEEAGGLTVQTQALGTLDIIQVHG